jgi:hypothetical protein
MEILLIRRIISYSMLLFLLLVPLIGFAQTKKPAKSQSVNKGDVVIFTGIILSEDRSPYDGIDVGIYEATTSAKDTGYSVKVGEGGVIQKPIGETDSAGRFTITLQRSVFGNAQDFVLIAIINSRWVQLEDNNGISIVIKIEKPTRNVDLKEIIVKRR